jgi:hypothetical protein
VILVGVFPEGEGGNEAKQGGAEIPHLLACLHSIWNRRNRLPADRWLEFAYRGEVVRVRILSRAEFGPSVSITFIRNPALRSRVALRVSEVRSCAHDSHCSPARRCVTSDMFLRSCAKSASWSCAHVRNECHQAKSPQISRAPPFPTKNGAGERSPAPLLHEPHTLSRVRRIRSDHGCQSTCAVLVPLKVKKAEQPPSTTGSR